MGFIVVYLGVRLFGLLGIGSCRSVGAVSWCEVRTAFILSLPLLVLVGGVWLVPFVVVGCCRVLM